VRWLDFKSSWGRQRSRAGSTPVIFRQLIDFKIISLLFNHNFLSISPLLLPSLLFKIALIPKF